MAVVNMTGKKGGSQVMYGAFSYTCQPGSARRGSAARICISKITGLPVRRCVFI